MSEPPAPIVRQLLEWAGAGLRDLPWRRTRDPWAILVAETMLQQTQVARVTDRWPRFLERFPDPTACARAPASDVLREWSGLGYNRRALMLHRAADDILTRHGGAVPAELSALTALPGVGPYTARAVRAFAFELEAAPVDTNIARVLARIVGTRLGPRAVQQLADSLVPSSDVWTWNQAIMEHGALVCTKRSPDCDDCVLAPACAWRGEGPDPAEGTAGVGRPQSRFEGSDRQLRGRVVDALREGPRTLEILAETAPDDPARRARVVEGLIADGLVERDGALLRLPGDGQTGPVSAPSNASIV